MEQHLSIARGARSTKNLQILVPRSWRSYVLRTSCGSSSVVESGILRWAFFRYRSIQLAGVDIPSTFLAGPPGCPVGTTPGL